jgi:hypothetical protein
VRTAIALCLLAGSVAGAGLGAAPALAAPKAIGPVDAPGGVGLSVSAPATATVRQQFQIRVRLSQPVSIAAFEASVLANNEALQVVAGIAGNGSGRMIDPAFSTSASRVGFFGAKAGGERSDLIDILVTPKRAGRIRIDLALPLGVQANGKVVPMHFEQQHLTVDVGRVHYVWKPSVPVRNTPLVPQGTLRYDVTGDGRFTRADLYQAVAAWDSTKANARSGGSIGATGDVDGDGFTTVRDLQLLAHRAPKAPKVVRADRGTTMSAMDTSFVPTKTWVVDSTSDLPDATKGDGICATADGSCSLRAAIDEANRRKGDDLITFAIPGGAPQTITLTSSLGQINSTGGAVEIDGYSEPGAHANTDPIVSNALPGIVINGGWKGATTKSYSLMLSSPNNIVQGLAFTNAGRAIYLYGPSAQNNYIVGNFIGMNANGVFQSNNGGYAGIDIDGASHNVIGTPSAANRNVIAGFFYGIDHVSPGTTYNVEQNNLIGTSPNGLQIRGAGCDDVDHNVGPQHNQLGGLGPHEGNVIVAGGCDGVEYSHGWNQAKPARQDTSIQYQVDDNVNQGNYIGYAPDGHYEYRYIEAQGRNDEQDASGVNVIDVSNGNLIEGNWIASHGNGVQIFGFQTENNIVRGNHFGVAPNGAPGYIGYSGVSVRWHASNEQIVGNDFHNTGQRTDQGPPPATNPNAYGCIANTANLPKGCSAGVRINEADDTGNLISQNTFQNIGNGIGIDLAPIGVVNPNDSGDVDTGANTKLNFPVITSATTAAITGTACGNCTVEVSHSSNPAGQYGMASSYIGSAVASATGLWSLPVGTLSAGDVVTSLAIDGANNTSELSLDVAVGQAPQPGTGIASDAFSRTVANGWGTADQGGPWSAVGTAADFAVNGSAATMSLAAGQTREARLAQLLQGDVSVAATFALDRVPVGGNAFAYVTARTQGVLSSSASYRGQIRIGANGQLYAQIHKLAGNADSAITPEVALGIAYAPGMAIRVRLSAVGSSPANLSLRAWPATQPEPSTWAVSGTDADAALQGAGGIGVRGYEGTAVTNGPAAMTWDDLSVSIATP